LGEGGGNESTGGERKNEKLTTHERKLANTIGEELNAEAQSSPNESRSTHHAAASCSSRSFPLQLLPNSRLYRSSQTVKRKKGNVLFSSPDPLVPSDEEEE